MRIAVDARPLSVPKTGVGRYLYEILRISCTTDAEHEYYLYSNKPFQTDFEDFHRVYKRTDPSRIGTLWVHTKLPRLLAQDKIDLFWGPNFTIPRFPRNIAKVLGIHDMVHHYYPQTLPRRIVLHQTYFLPHYAKWADLILADSFSTKNDIIEVMSVPENKVRVVHPAAEQKKEVAEDGQAVFDRFGINTSGYILYVGTIEPRKNIDGIIRCYARLRGTLSELPQLVIAGGWGWKYEKIKELVRELNIEEQIIFTGYVGEDDLAVLYKNAGLLFYPSFYEGFGLPPLEAMCYGIPVICSNTSSLPEVVGDAAIKVDPYGLDEMYNALFKMCTDKALRQNFAKRALERSKQFSWEKAARETLAVFEEAYRLKKEKSGL